MNTVTKNFLLKILSTQKRENWAISLMNSIGYGETSIDSEVTNFFSMLGKVESEPFAILDIGASEGDWSNLALQQCDNVFLYCFEPQYKSFSILSKKLNKFIHLNRCTVFNYALGDKNEELDLYSSSEGSGAASLYRRVGKNDAKISKIPVKKFEEIIGELSIPIIGMKIDTEGFEFEILKAAQNLLALSSFKLIQFEFGEYTIEKHQSCKMYFDFLSEHKFKIHRMSKFGLTPILFYEPRLEVHWNTNYLAVKEILS